MHLEITTIVVCMYMYSISLENCINKMFPNCLLPSIETGIFILLSDTDFLKILFTYFKLLICDLLKPSFYTYVFHDF